MADQDCTPLFDAVKKHIDNGVTQFHVPGHKAGQGLEELRQYIGSRAMQMDLNGMEDLDYINHPTGPLLEAQQLMAEAYNADKSYFLVNGTTSGVQAMILAACRPGDKIIVPRNAHRSTIGGIILSDALPIYIQPEINTELGIAMGISLASVQKTIRQHPDTRAIFLINPTYYGYTSDLPAIVELAHQHNITVLVDEAHGSHLHFHPRLPVSAMDAGADMAAASMHKTGGSLTQSSVLLYRRGLVENENLESILNLSYTSSASYLLMCSLDLARKQLATRGEGLLERVLSLAGQARTVINEIGGLYAFGAECAGTPGSVDFDESKLGVNVCRLGMSGYEIEGVLRKEFNLQIELADLSNILAIVSMGHDPEDLKKLTDALRRVSYSHIFHNNRQCPKMNQCPEMVVTPRTAFYSRHRVVPLNSACGEIAAEMIMAYPPGIPILCLGERITPDIIDYVKWLKNEQCELQGTADPGLEYIRVLA